ncbi:hypothetical protein C7S18_19890 [Ahniella affigens]|uniref:Uncharacterized protein n=2 Tax=Ahniella affigens TaxID=2021234 RepID=A0A2P1PWS7_9GAMM|nr:hypothetical protein C7S18_19890 [Ahniella affigens]
MFTESEKGIGALVHAKSETELASAERLLFGDSIANTQLFCVGYDSSMSDKGIELDLLRAAANDDRYSSQVDAVLRLPTGISPEQRSEALVRWSNRNDPRAAWYLVKKSLLPKGETGLGSVSDRDLFRALRLAQLSFDDWQDSDRIGKLQQNLESRLGPENVSTLDAEVRAAIPPEAISIYPRDSKLLVGIPTPGIAKCE